MPDSVGESTWALLERRPSTGSRLTVLVACPQLTNDVLLGVDSGKRRSVLLRIPAGEPSALSERSSRGIAANTVEMLDEAGQSGVFVEIACLESQGHAALSTLAVELAEAVNAGASIGRIRLVQNLLAKWRRFWSGASLGTLSTEQQLGLFGELWFLKEWLIPAVGATRALGAWRGPTGSRNDFEAEAVAIEVKTTARVDAAHVINGLEQLLEPPGGSLFLFALSVRDEASGNATLAGAVEQLRGLLHTDHLALSRLDVLLDSAGYDDRFAAEYARRVFRIRSEALYKVDSHFPRLVPMSIVGGLPAGVATVSYDLRLEAAGASLLAQESAAAEALLDDFVK
jgi:Putative  PD-(D/E)XK family member, (DUF4420)